MKKVLILVVLTAAACNDSPATNTGRDTLPSLSGAPIRSGLGLVLGTAFNYTTSGVDALDTAPAALTHPNIMVADGDAVLRRAGDVAVIINRGEASNLIVVDGTLAPVAQVALAGCGPHDLAVLDDHRVVLTCFEEKAMRIVDFASGEVTAGPDLSAFADADGIPEMDQIGRSGGALWVSLELLDRNDAFWAPTGPGLVVALDESTLDVIDLDPATPGVQGLPVCTNPYSRFANAPDGRLLVGCSGVYGVADTSAVVAIDPTLRTVSTVADGPAVGGQLADIGVSATGQVFAVISYPYTKAFEPADDMRLVRLDPTGAVMLYAAPGGKLGGFTIGADGAIWVANRSMTTAGSTGIWRVPAAGGDPTGPIETTLPPRDLEIF